MKTLIVVFALLMALMAPAVYGAGSWVTNTLSATSFTALPVSNWATRDVYLSQPVSCTYVYIWCLSGEFFVKSPKTPSVNFGSVTNVTGDLWTRLTGAAATNILKMAYPTSGILTIKTTNTANNLATLTFE
ncbi:MAG: hypothetical protein NTV22_11340 [bacterium]|nr:hypothetical protein [bacterium]